MISLKDLSEEERNSLLQEARTIVFNEQLEKDSAAVYGVEKKAVFEESLNRIYSQLGIDNNKHYASSHRRAIKDRLTSMSNYLYKIASSKIENIKLSKPPVITSIKEWNTYLLCLHNTEACIISTYNNKPLKVDEENV